MLTRVELRVFDSAKGWVHIRLLEGRVEAEAELQR